MEGNRQPCVQAKVNKVGPGEGERRVQRGEGTGPARADDKGFALPGEP